MGPLAHLSSIKAQNPKIARCARSCDVCARQRPDHSRAAGGTPTLSLNTVSGRREIFGVFSNDFVGYIQYRALGAGLVLTGGGLEDCVVLTGGFSNI